jgi:hypothetical protein
MGSAQSFRSFLVSFVAFFICQPSLMAVGGLPDLIIPFAFLLAALRPEDGEAHRVAPEFPVGLHVFGFFLHDDTSLNGFVTRGSAIDTLARVQDGVRPHPVHPLAHQVDPGVCLNPAFCCFEDPGHHDSFLPGLSPFVKPIIDISRRKKIGARLNVV